MSLKPETRFLNRVRPCLQGLPHTWFVKTQQMTTCGTPDLLLCIRGRFVAIELKSTAKAPITTLQRHQLGRIQGAGGIGLVVHPENWLTVYKQLQNLALEDRLDQSALQATQEPAVPSRLAQNQ